MYFRQIYIFIIAISFFTTSCQKLVNDPGGEDTNIEVDNGLSYWGGAYDDFGHAVVQTTDGGYAVVGSQYAIDTQQDLMLITFSSTLAFVSDTSFGGANSAYNNVANDLQQTADGGYILVGTTYHADSLDSDVWIVKYSSTLAVTWQDTIDGGNNDVGQSVHQTQDGGYIVCGTSNDGNDDDIMLWKIAADGLSHSILYSETTNGGEDNGTGDEGIYAQQTEDGGYIIVGNSFSTASAKDIHLIKLNVSSGNTEIAFDSTYNITDGYYNDEAVFVQEIDDGMGFVVVGNYWASGYGQNNVFVLKTDYQGTDASTSIATFGGGYNDFGNCVRQTGDGGFIIAGSKLSQATTNEDVWILKLTHDLSTEWEETYGGSADDIGTSVHQTTDGGYIITGNTYSYGNQSEIILLKIDGSGVIQDFSN